MNGEKRPRPFSLDLGGLVDGLRKRFFHPSLSTNFFGSLTKAPNPSIDISPALFCAVPYSSKVDSSLLKQQNDFPSFLESAAPPHGCAVSNSRFSPVPFPASSVVLSDACKRATHMEHQRALTNDISSMLAGMSLTNEVVSGGAAPVKQSKSILTRSQEAMNRLIAVKNAPPLTSAAPTASTGINREPTQEVVCENYHEESKEQSEDDGVLVISDSDSEVHSTLTTVKEEDDDDIVVVVEEDEVACHPVSAVSANSNSGSKRNLPARPIPDCTAALFSPEMALQTLVRPLPTVEVQRYMNTCASEGSDDKVLQSSGTLRFRVCDSADLRPRSWLRDGVINFFFRILRLAGEDALHSGRPRATHCWAHTSFFYGKLVGQHPAPPRYNYEGVRGWTAAKSSSPPVDIFAYKRVIFPVNIRNVHWTMVLIDMEERKVYFYDSMSGNGKEVADFVIRYLKDEWADKKGRNFPFIPFTQGKAPKDLPQQNNGNDCGAFVCAFGECLARGLIPSTSIFSQADLGYWRSRIGLTNFRGCLLE